MWITDSANEGASIVDASKPVAMVDGEPLPPGWFKALDPSFNHPYYYNPNTGERRWKKPKPKLPQGWFSGIPYHLWITNSIVALGRY